MVKTSFAVAAATWVLAVAPASAQGQSTPRPYQQVITPGAQSSEGLFGVHLVGERLYFEVPSGEFGAEFLAPNYCDEGICVKTSFTRPGHVLAFTRQGSRLLLWTHSYSARADSASALYPAVRTLRQKAIIATFPIESWGPDSAAVIDVTRLFTTLIAEFARMPQLQSDRSFITRATAFPRSIRIEGVQSGQLQQPTGPLDPTGQTMSMQPTSRRFVWTLLKLPDTPMRPRLHDEHVGFEAVDYIDYTSAREHGAVRSAYVIRFRLEKKNPGAAVSDPVQPIVFYIDPATPKWLVPWIKQGVEAWQPAFREAGFSDAILARQAPSNTEDPKFSMDDARYSVVRWEPSTRSDGTAVGVVDPRTGELLSTQVVMWHNIMHGLRNQYFVQASPNDPRGRKFPFTDSLMGRLVQSVVEHEVGHALAFPHNMKASAMYPADSLRSVTFLRRMGHTPSIMDYARFNYVVQPEDRIPVDLLPPRVGPYDRFAIVWAYKPIPGASTPTAELPTLRQWARMQDSVPWLRFSDNRPADRTAQTLTEAVGDEDPVQSNTFGLKNLDRVMQLLLETRKRVGGDFPVEELYGEILAQWWQYGNHVAAQVAGWHSDVTSAGLRTRPVPPIQQRAALQWILQHVFHAPEFLVSQDVGQIVGEGAIVQRISSTQARHLNELLSVAKLSALAQQAGLTSASERVTPAELLDRVRRGLWRELTVPNVSVSLLRRALQRAHVNVLADMVNPPERLRVQVNTAFDARANAREQLVRLASEIAGAMTRSSDDTTRRHLQDLSAEIQRTLAAK